MPASKKFQSKRRVLPPLVLQGHKDWCISRYVFNPCARCIGRPNKAYFYDMKRKCPTCALCTPVHQRVKLPWSEDETKYKQELLRRQAKTISVKRGPEQVVVLEHDIRDGPLSTFLRGYRSVSTDSLCGSHHAPALWECAELSPGVVAPPPHCQPGIPDVKTVRDLYQLSTWTKSLSWKEFQDRRLSGFVDKLGRQWNLKMKESKGVHGFVWQKEDGPWLYSHVESRRFYCHALQIVYEKTPTFQKLKTEVKAGVPLCIVVSRFKEGRKWSTYSAQKHRRTYLSGTHSYHHGHVLHAMLTLSPEDYPWRKYSEGVPKSWLREIGCEAEGPVAGKPLDAKTGDIIHA